MTRTILTEAGATQVSPGDGAWLSAADALAATGWDLKPEGMCRGEICVPLPAALRRGGSVDIAGFWALLGAPAIADVRGETWSLGTEPAARNAALASGEAPDFDLPDLAGARHRLSDYHGRKRLLVTWASW